MTRARTLRIAPGFNMPVDAVTQTFSILAKRGKGKTYTASVLVEELVKAGQSVCVVDPIGVWWGLRSSADGQQDGLPVLVLGGEHGDLPIDESAGELVADLVVDERTSTIVDLSSLRKAAQRRFMTAFAERLYHRNREALHLVLEEADLFAPQRPPKGGERLLGAIEDLVRRGRSRGIGVTLITQRSAVLNKDVLTQTEVLITLGMTGPQDQKAVEEWIKHHGDEDGKKDLMASLPGLPVGEAWVWSPGWLGVLQRIKVRERETFDSSATPKAGERARAPKRVAAVDLDAWRGKLAALVEKKDAEDPAKLRARIRDLERDLAKAVAASADPVVERVEVPVLGNGALEKLDAVLERVEALYEEVRELQANAEDIVRTIPNVITRVTTRVNTTRDEAVLNKSVSQGTTPAGSAVARAPPRAPASPAPDGVTPAMQRVLDALAWLESLGLHQAPKNQVAFLAGASPKSSAFANNLGALRARHDLIDYPGPGLVQLTDRGRAVALHPPAVLTPDELHARVRDRLPPAKWRLLEVLISTYPAPVEKDVLADRAGASPKSSAFANNLGNLRTLGLVEYPSPGVVRAAPVLFLEGPQ